jgi:prepilin-type N-terminal cleavage/methylation domain-containing protein
MQRRGGENKLKVRSSKLEVKRGFTLIELLIVVALVGLLAVAVIVTLNPAQRIRDAKTNTAKHDGKTAADAIERCLTTYLTANPSFSENQAITYCSTAANLGITLGGGQVLNAAPDGSSVCFSEETGTVGVFVKFTHAAGGVTNYVENAVSACVNGV